MALGQSGICQFGHRFGPHFAVGGVPFDFTAAMGMMTRWLEGGFKMPVPQQGIEQPAFVPPVRKPPMEAGSGSWLAAALYLALMLLLTLLVLGVALAIIGLVIIGFLQEEWERLPALLRLPVYIYLWVKGNSGSAYGRVGSRCSRRKEASGQAPASRLPPYFSSA